MQFDQAKMLICAVLVVTVPYLRSSFLAKGQLPKMRGLIWVVMALGVVACGCTHPSPRLAMELNAGEFVRSRLKSLQPPIGKNVDGVIIGFVSSRIGLSDNPAFCDVFGAIEDEESSYFGLYVFTTVNGDVLTGSTSWDVGMPFDRPIERSAFINVSIVDASPFYQAQLNAILNRACNLPENSVGSWDGSFMTIIMSVKNGKIVCSKVFANTLSLHPPADLHSTLMSDVISLIHKIMAAAHLTNLEPSSFEELQKK